MTINSIILNPIQNSIIFDLIDRIKKLSVPILNDKFAKFQILTIMNRKRSNVCKKKLLF